MTRVLLVTNDFPPRRGGIQSYLEAFVGELNAAGGHELTVYAPQWKGAPEYDEHAGYRVVRHRGTLMVPEPTVAHLMRALIAEHDIETVWFGAAAPLGVLGERLRREYEELARAARERRGDDAGKPPAGPHRQ